MIKMVFLIFEPGVTWEKIAQARRGFGFILVMHVLPLIVLAAGIEGWGLCRWGHWQPQFHKIREFPASEVIVFEALQAVMFLVMVLASAFLLRNISQTFDRRRNFLQAFTTVAYSYSPLFVIHAFNAGPMINPWLCWALGIASTVWILYQGVPRVMQPDATHAFGLFLSAVIVQVLVSGTVRVLTVLFLLGKADVPAAWLIGLFPGLAH